MKKIIINIGLIPGLLLLLSLNACNEKIDPVVSELSFSRAFTPTGLSAQISNITTVTLSWVAVTNVDHYVVEIYNGIDIVPGNLLYTTDVDATATTYKYVLPAGDTQFSARINVVSSLDGVAESKWISVGFKTAPENLFLGFISELSGLGTCTVRWKPGSVATALVFDNGTQTSYAISAAEATAGVKIVTGIAKGKYQIILMNSTFVRGRTNTFIEGDVFLSAGGDLAAAINALPAGGVILLKNGDNFSFTGPVALTKSIKIR